jgi:hypothetical protein
VSLQNHKSKPPIKLVNHQNLQSNPPIKLLTIDCVEQQPQDGADGGTTREPAHKTTQKPDDVRSGNRAAQPKVDPFASKHSDFRPHWEGTTNHRW